MLEQTSPIRKILISPGQALLLLMNDRQKSKKSYDDLKRLYLTGITDPASDRAMQQCLREFINNQAYQNYRISFTYHCINEEPTRRYFETHLALHTVQKHIDNLSTQELSDCNAWLRELATSRNERVYDVFTGITYNLKNVLTNVIGNVFEKGPFKKNDETNFLINTYWQLGLKDLLLEYHNALNQLENGTGPYQHFNLNDEQKKRLALIFQNTFLAVLANQFAPSPLPLAIYGTGIFSAENRGKIPRLGQSNVTSRSTGTMKSYMPAPYANDSTLTEQESSQLRPADQARFFQSQWVCENFLSMVHPFSNSISGTLLCQIRAYRKARDERQAFLSDMNQIKNYFRNLIAIMLYHSGGHTLHEFTAVLMLPEVRDAFKDLYGFDQINEASLFLEGNENAFNLALQETIQYNDIILKRKMFQQELLERSPGHTSNIARMLENDIDRIYNQIGQSSSLRDIMYTEQCYAATLSILFQLELKWSQILNNRVDVVKELMVWCEAILNNILKYRSPNSQIPILYMFSNELGLIDFTKISPKQTIDEFIKSQSPFIATLCNRFQNDNISNRNASPTSPNH